MEAAQHVMHQLNDAVEKACGGTSFDASTLKVDERYHRLRKIVLRQLGKPFTPLANAPLPADAPALPRPTTTKPTTKPKTAATTSTTTSAKRARKEPSTQTAVSRACASLDCEVISCEPVKKRPRSAASTVSTENTVTKSFSRSKPKTGNNTKSGKDPKDARSRAYRGAPSRSVLTRMDRASRRLFLVQKRTLDLGMFFNVMGSNGNIYDVAVGLQPSCSCPDFMKREGTRNSGPCKHLIFVFLRVLKLEKKDPRWWQAALTENELDGLFDAVQYIRENDAVMAELSVQQQLEGQAQAKGQAQERRKEIGGDCCICFDEMIQTEAISFCEACGNNFHKVCLDNWCKAQTREAKCALCRQPLKAKSPNSSEYLNLAQYSTAHSRQLTLAEMYQDTHRFITRRQRQS